MLEHLRAAGDLAPFLLAPAVLGVLASLLSYLLLARRPRAALALGAAAVLLAGASAGVGAYAVQHGRASADAVLREADGDEVADRQLRRLRRLGYLQARRPARVALAVAALPFFAGAALMVAAARRRAARLAPPPDPEIPFTPRPRLLFPVLVTLGGALGGVAAIASHYDRIPGGEPSLFAARRVAADVARLRGLDEHEAILAACESLEADLGDAADPSAHPALPAVARVCVEEALQDALARQHGRAIHARLDLIRRSPFLVCDPTLGALVDDTRVKLVRELAAAPVLDGDG
jgi:hypothetical protein